MPLAKANACDSGLTTSWFIRALSGSIIVEWIIGSLRNGQECPAGFYDPPTELSEIDALDPNLTDLTGDY